MASAVAPWFDCAPVTFAAQVPDLRAEIRCDRNPLS
jgi:hypothetical protein